MKKNIFLSILLILFFSFQIKAQEDDENINSKSLTDFIDATVIKITKVIPDLSGYVIHKKDNEVYIDLGRKQGVTNDMEFFVIREIKDIKHPVRNEFAGKVEEKIGEIKVKTLRDTLSITESISILEGKSFEIGDKIYSKKRWQKIALLPIYNTSREEQYFTQVIHDLLKERIDRTTYLDLIDKEKVNKLLEQSNLINSNNFFPSKTLKLISEKLNVEILVLGNLLDLGEEFFLNLRFVSGVDGSTIFVINTELRKTKKIRALVYSMLPSNMHEELKIIHAPLHNAPKTLDPSQVFTQEEKEVSSHIYDRLISLDSTSTLAPSLAESWNVSKDGKILLFNLKQNIIFHNGDNFTAKNVLESWQYEILNGGEHGARELLSSISGVFEYKNKNDNIEGLEILDDYTLQITLKEIDPDFLIKLTFINTSVFSGKSLKDNIFKNPIGTGAFKCISQNEEKIVLEKNNDYTDNPPMIDKIEYQIISDPTLEYQKYLNKEIDYYYVEGLTKIEEDKKENLVKSDFSITYFVMINCKNSPFNNEKIRAAINNAIDREYFAKNSDEVILTNSIIPVREKKSEINFPYSFNQTEVRKILEENGFMSYFSKEFDMYYPEGSLILKQIAEKIQENLISIGLKIKLHKKTLQEMNSLQEATVQPTFILSNFIFTNKQDNSFYFKKLFSANAKGSLNNYGFYSSAIVDSLINSIAETDDLDKKAKIYIEIENTILRDAPWIFLFTENKKIIKQSNIEGITINEFGVNLKRSKIKSGLE